MMGEERDCREVSFLAVTDKYQYKVLTPSKYVAIIMRNNGVRQDRTDNK